MKDYNLNTYEKVVLALGRAGMTKTNTMKRSDILSFMVEHSWGTKKQAIDHFKNTFKRSGFLIKTESSEYSFTDDGWKTYKKLDSYIAKIENHSTELKQFFDIWLNESIETMIRAGSHVLKVPYLTISKGLGPEFMNKLSEDPENTIKDLNIALSGNAQVESQEYNHDPVIEITGLLDVMDIEDARKAEHLGKLIEVKGRVVLQTQTKPQAVIAAFECQRCGHVQFIDQHFGSPLIEPLECENDVCERRGPFKMLSRPETEFIDSQLITLESPKGQLQLKVALQSSQCQPPWIRDGKIVRVVGVLHHSAQYLRNGRRSDFEYILVANSVRFADDSMTSPPTKEDIELFEDWAKDPLKLRQKLLNSVAPHIYGHMIQKDAASLALFSDWTWDKDPAEVVVRSSIHILFIGDPGVAKSQIVKDVLHLAPKSKWAQIVGSTKGGLANSAIQVNGEWVIKAGIFSHADQGVLGLDEIDKFPNRDDLNCLINVLEDQIQIVSKVGMSEIPFNGRTAVLATANPKYGHLNKIDPIPDQLDLPPYIIQRFDLVFVIMDTPDKDQDQHIAESIHSIHRYPETGRKSIEREISIDLFRKYVVYARTKPIPALTLAAENILSDFYLAIRNKSTAYPLISSRALNNLNRLARAIARREMAAEVTEEHAQYAVSLFKSSLLSLSFGENDPTVFEFGTTQSQRERVKAITTAIQALCKQHDFATIDDIIIMKGLDRVNVEHTIQMLHRKGEIMRVGAGFRLIR